VEQAVTVEQPSLRFDRRRIKVNRLAIGKTLVILASGLMLLYLVSVRKTRSSQSLGQCDMTLIQFQRNDG
jgi:hypothetical protein